MEPTAPELTTALFEIQDGKHTGADRWMNPQKFIAAIPGATLTGFGNLLKCDTQYQIDIYRPLPDGTKPDVLWKDGYLHYAHDGAFLAYNEVDYTPYKLFTTPPCLVVEPEPEPTEPEVTPSPSTPPTTASPTPVSNPSGGYSAPGVSPTPTINPSPITTKLAAPVSPNTERKGTGTPTLPAGTSSSLAYTGADNGPLVGLAVLLVFVGALGFVLAKNRNRK